MDRILQSMVAKTSPNPRLKFRFGDHADIETVSNFIDQHWQSGHVLSRDRELFEYMFLEKDGRFNFALAIDQNTDELIAILGYLPTDSSHSRVSLSMWKARPDAELRKYKAGLAVLRFLIEELKPKSIFSTGISIDTRDIYRFLGYSCDVMNHHVIINDQITNFKILLNPPVLIASQSPAKVRPSSILPFETRFHFQEFAQRFDLEKSGKDLDYLIHRYLDHPHFQYSVREVLADDKAVGLIIFRRFFANDRSCIRIIDVVGAEVCLKSAIQPLIQEMLANGDEYIDLLSWGLDDPQVKEIGFLNCQDIPSCIVPEYFSPFSQTKVDRWLFTNLPQSEKFFKGDGDQDRPN